MTKIQIQSILAAFSVALALLTGTPAVFAGDSGETDRQSVTFTTDSGGRCTVTYDRRTRKLTSSGDCN